MLGDGLDQRLAKPGALLDELGRDRLLVVMASELVVVDEGLREDEIHDPAEPLPVPERDLDGVRVGLQPLAHHLDDPPVVGPDPVHLVDEGDAGNAVAVRLAPDGLGLRLHAGHGAEDSHGTVEDAQGALDLDGEVDVPGGIDDVDPVLRPRTLPVGGRRGRGDRDPALLFLLHPVHRRRPVMDLPHAVQAPGVEQDALGRGGLAGVDVRHDPDVPESIERVSPWHRICFLPSCGEANCGRQSQFGWVGVFPRPPVHETNAQQR